MEDLSSMLVLAVLAVGPFLISVLDFRKRDRTLEEPSFKVEGGEITAFPVCIHCGWQGEIDVSDFVKAAAEMKESTILKSPPCYKCGQRWKINLTGIVQKFRQGVLA